MQRNPFRGAVLALGLLCALLLLALAALPVLREDLRLSLGTQDLHHCALTPLFRLSSRCFAHSAEELAHSELSEAAEHSQRPDQRFLPGGQRPHRLDVLHARVPLGGNQKTPSQQGAHQIFGFSYIEIPLEGVLAAAESFNTHQIHMR